MNDIEVGEIWEQCTHGNWKGTHAGHRCIHLILMLINDRAWRKSYLEACSDFGIPYEEYFDVRKGSND